MSRVCSIRKVGTRAGRRIARKGLSKQSGGIGLNTTGVSRRTFKVNTQTKRIWVPELKKHVRVKLSARAMKTIDKKGAYRTLLEAGLVKPIQPGQKAEG